MKKTLLSTALAMLPLVAAANHDMAIELVEVVAEASSDATDIKLFSEAPLTRPIHDAGELLRSVNGMGAARRGGRGFEPIIRGQSQNRINVITNGAYNFGACPGRMDPPSTYVGFDSFDQVSVIKGNRSVIYGAGGSGGTLIFEHQRPEFGANGYTGKLAAGHTSNSDINSISADVAVGNDRAFVRLFAENKSSENYEDGDGRTVSSAFDSNSVGIIAGGDLTDADYLELSFERANEDDIWYAGNGMDAPYADSEMVRLKWEHNAAIGVLDNSELTVYRSDVSHLMDNYSLRARNMMPNGMAAPSSSDTWGGRLMGRIETANTEWRLGMDYKANDRSATLYMDAGKNGSYDMLVSRMWPDIEQRQMGIFTEVDYQYDEDDMLRVGLRYDDFSSETTSATVSTGMKGSATPVVLYQTFYGTNSDEMTSGDIGWVLGWDRQLDQRKLLSVNLSRSVRTPDASENFMARSAGGNFWVGNPDINPEAHQQLDVTVISRHGDKHWSATVFWDEVSDYIERYKNGTATLYRNTDASLRGVELEAASPLTESLSLRAALSYTRGDGDNGDLGQISPLEARVNLDYSRTDWAIGAELIMADRQEHIDEDNDVAEDTVGFGVLNLFGNWRVQENLVMEAGVENVFDKTYAYHVNTSSSDPFDPTAIRVNEPGRQYWVKMRYSF